MAAAISSAGPITPQGEPNPCWNCSPNHWKSWMCFASSSAK